MKQPEKIVVGSTNRAKLTAVRSTIQRVWPDAEIVGVDVDTGVSVMPMSDDECLAGARNRAEAALAALDADLGIGLEGGVQAGTPGLMLMGWVVIVDGNGRVGTGGCARIPLPEAIAMRVLTGEELGPVMDDVLNEHDTRQRGGAVGALTDELVLRGDAFAQAVAYALAPFVASHLYDSP